MNIFLNIYKTQYESKYIFHCVIPSQSSLQIANSVKTSGRPTLFQHETASPCPFPLFGKEVPQNRIFEFPKFDVRLVMPKKPITAVNHPTFSCPSNGRDQNASEIRNSATTFSDYKNTSATLKSQPTFFLIFTHKTQVSGKRSKEFCDLT